MADEAGGASSVAPVAHDADAPALPRDARDLDDVLGPGATTPAHTRVLTRLARSVGRNGLHISELEPLVKALRTRHPRADVRDLERAYQVAEHFHEGQTRRSGEPYITHPLAVATILAELGMTTPTLQAALLHDTIEDTAYTLEELRQDFGDEVADLVDGVTKLDKVKYGQAAQAETVRKMVIAMAKDIRVLVIKLADRLHNARTWRYVPKESARRKAHETLEIYAPLAHRLGMNTIKWELEDLSFATLHPKVYDEIVRLVAERAQPMGRKRDFRCRGKGRERSLEIRGFEQVVGVHHAEKRAARAGGSSIAGARQALPLDVQHAGARAREVSQQPARRAVVRAVVDDDHLEVLVGLGLEAVERLVEIPAEVVAGDDEGGPWGNRHRAHPCVRTVT